MRKKFIVLLVTIMIMSLAACNNKDVSPNSSGKSSASGSSFNENAPNNVNDMLSKDLYEVYGGTIANIEFVKQETDISSILSSEKDRDTVFQALEEQLKNYGYEVRIDSDRMSAESGDYSVSLMMDSDSTVLGYEFWGFESIDAEKAAAEISYFAGVPVSADEITSYFEYVDTRHNEDGHYYLSGTNDDYSVYFHVESKKSDNMTYLLSIEREF